ncbi:type-F conjugative transfer system pilin assembly protein TrbC [Acinetobacter nosocomialis]|uniref:type-F conjugative transfer system pilin assembly protein TrbC n=1 Tax=Acinetobacter nosocomialis TaxID=106654 RepID=UPI0029DC3B09|nr:type-F conjugative transfer system pilin assembly protein TrbC [Acinetobacter nosocomialis]MDX7882093.1 type-F conjugative transfer system pilin assembly protein TrbC [Acinetobacter nosocomialis]
MKKILLVGLISISFNVFSADFPSDQAIQQEMQKVQNQKFSQQDWEKAQQKALEQIEKTKSVEARPNNFPNVQAVRPTGIDIGNIAARYKRKVETNKSIDGVVAFASLSMPKESLKKLVIDVSNVGGAVVFRGFKDGNYMEMAKAISQIGVKSANIQINPTAFKQYKVEAVPAIVLVKPGAGESLDEEGCVLPENHTKVTGDVSLLHALELIEKEDKSFSSIAQRYLSFIRGGNSK